MAECSWSEPGVVFFWFIATAVITVGFVFRDPTFDNRLLMVGSVLPGFDIVFGRSRVLHSVTVSIALLTLVMLATDRGSVRRKTLLGLPIGMILHLVFDAAWNDTATFWWPFTGLAFDDVGMSITDRGLVSVVLEAAGFVLCIWLWRINGLGGAARMRRFLADGQLITTPERRA
ncbi:MAG: hypothetical protein GKR86_13030 [Ilumatobacter sp.]|nr:hypothetical protein [Ilumatobacter sp.]